MEDNIIVDLYLKRDQSAITETDNKHGGRMRTLSYRILGNESDVDEAMNDSYMKVWDSIPPHEPRGYLPAFLMRIVRCVSVDARRRRGIATRLYSEIACELDEIASDVDESEAMIDEMTFERNINEFLSLLNDDARRIFLLRYWRLEGTMDIALVMEKSESAVYMSLSRTRAKLRKYLEERKYSI